MKTKLLFLLMGIAIVFSSYKPNSVKSFSINLAKTSVKISGTSTLHDWDEVVKKVDGTASLVLGESNAVEGISSLNVNFYSSSLSSGKSGMDDKTTEALKATTYPKISFVLSKVISNKVIKGANQITVSGNLSIAGVTKNITTTGYCAVNASGELNIIGSQSLDMTQYGVTPPSAMFGTITSGKDISIVYTLSFK
jgi:polyisoprenoid-binding protein YceI